MDLPSPTEEDVHSDMATIQVQIPYVFRGRDFSAKNDIFLQKIMELMETWIASSAKAELKDDVCECHGFLKAQHIIIHNPSIMTLEFAQKTFLSVIKNNNKTNVFLKRYPIKVGNTSSMQVMQLVYVENNKTYPLISIVMLDCHIDLKTQRPIKVCDAQRNLVKTELSKKSETELSENENMNKAFSANMDKMNVFFRENGNKNDRNSLFECHMQIQHTDFDWNGHVNQSEYGKYIENTLIEYCDDYCNAKYHISGVTIDYVHEMTLNAERKEGLPFCTVKILNDVVEDGNREIIGIITKDDKACVKFKLRLIKYKHDRLFSVRSRWRYS